MDRYGDLATDLRQVADTAIWQYAPRAPNRHPGYLTSCALGACKRYLRDCGYPIRLPAKLLEAGQRPPIMLRLPEYATPTNGVDVEAVALSALQSEQRWSSLGLTAEELHRLKLWADDQTEEEVQARLAGSPEDVTNRIRELLEELQELEAG